MKMDRPWLLRAITLYNAPAYSMRNGRQTGRSLKSCQCSLDAVAGFVEGFLILATGWPKWTSDEEERSGTQGVNARLAAGRGWRSEWLGRSGWLRT